jgi:hypothetical protein
MGQGDPGGQHQAGVGQRRFHKVLFRESHFGFGVTGSGSPLSMHGFSTASVSRPFGGGILGLFRAQEETHALQQMTHGLVCSITCYFRSNMRGIRIAPAAAPIATTTCGQYPVRVGHIGDRNTHDARLDAFGVDTRNAAVIIRREGKP